MGRVRDAKPRNHHGEVQFYCKQIAKYVFGSCGSEETCSHEKNTSRQPIANPEHVRCFLPLVFAVGLFALVPVPEIRILAKKFRGWRKLATVDPSASS